MKLQHCLSYEKIYCKNGYKNLVLLPPSKIFKINIDTSLVSLYRTSRHLVLFHSHTFMLHIILVGQLRKGSRSSSIYEYSAFPSPFSHQETTPFRTSKGSKPEVDKHYIIGSCCFFTIS